MGSTLSQSNGCDAGPPKFGFNPDDPVNVAMDVPGACLPEKDISQLAAQMNNNGEYSFLGAGDTCQCGRRAMFKRTAYKADPLQCCLSNASTIGNYTCDPQYRNGTSTACASIMSTFCSDPSNALSDPGCTAWCAVNPAVCAQSKANACDTLDALTNTPGCLDFCLKNPGMCDSGMVAYCAVPKNSSTAACKCLNSVLVDKKYNPLCGDNACISGGYATSSMLTSRGSGCTIVDCSSYFNIKDANVVNMSGTRIEQQCGDKSASSGSLSSNVSAPGDSVVQESLIFGYPAKTVYTYGFGLLLGVIVVIVIVRRRRSSSSPVVNTPRLITPAS